MDPLEASTVFHLLSFYVLFRFSAGLLKSRQASMIAVLGYATSFNLLWLSDRQARFEVRLSSSLLALKEIEIILEKDQDGNIKMRPVQPATGRRSASEFKLVPTRVVKTDHKIWQGAAF